MPVDGDVPWSKPPHTDAKHRIYQAYLRKWFPILLSDNGYPSVTYAEGFSGPGVYDDGSPGSPVIAIQTLLDTPELEDSRKVTRFIFIDNDQRCVALLRQELINRFPHRPRPPDQMPVSIRFGDCAKDFEPELDALGAWHQPILAVFDSWGNVPVPYHLIRRIAQNPSSEVLVTFGPQHFIRFVDQLDERIDDVFGHDSSWRAVTSMTDGAQKKKYLLGRYRSSLKDAGFRYLLDFELVDLRGEHLYLVFGTNHRRGLEKMKESLWEVDQVRGIGFRDPKDIDGPTLFDLSEPDLAPLRNLLLEQLSDGEPVRVEALRDYALFSTVYREQHVIPALSGLRERERIVTSDLGPIRRATFVRRKPAEL